MLAYVLKAETPAETPASSQLSDPWVALYADGMAIAPPLEPEALLQLADENAAHGACLDVKADDAVGRGWTLEPVGNSAPATDPDQENVEPADGRPEGADAEAASDALAEALEGITPDYTFAELLWQAQWERDAIGWSGWEVVRQGAALDGPIAALYPMPANTFRCTKDRDVFVQIRGGSAVYFRRFGSGIAVNSRTGAKEGQDQRVSGGRRSPRNSVAPEDQAHEILVFRSYSPRNQWYPIPRWVSAIPAIAELTAIREFNVAFFGSGGVVDRIIHATAPEAAEAQALADSVKEQLETAAAEAGAHLTIATGGTVGTGIEVTFLVPPGGRRDGQFGARRGELIEEVLMAHKVPPYRVSRAITGALGGSPTREMLQTYRTGTIEPSQSILESRLNQQLFGAPGIDLQGYVWRLEDLGWDETALDLDIAAKATDAALTTPDEGRELIGKSPTKLPEMGRYYYKGVALGQPRTIALPGAAPAMSTLEQVRERAQVRLAARIAAKAEGNGHGPKLTTIARG